MDGCTSPYGLSQPTPMDRKLLSSVKSQMSEFPETKRGIVNAAIGPSSKKPFAVVMVTVGPSPPVEREWCLPIGLLTKHSAYLRTACIDSSITRLTLSTTHPSTFRNYVDFIYSNIYSPNKRAADYHPILSNAQAWVLGDKLEAPSFKDAAFAALYNEVEGCARREGSSAWRSPIRASDIEWVCEQADVGCVLRCMLFDAVASHWIQSEVLNIGRNTTIAMDPKTPTFPAAPITTWFDVYNKCPDFRMRLANSFKVDDASRGNMLRPMEEYMKGIMGMKEDEVDEKMDLGRGRRTKRARLLVRRRVSGDGVQSRGRRSTSLEAAWDGRTGGGEGSLNFGD